MSDIISVAEKVRDTLADLNAEISFAPDFDLADLEVKRCVIVPHSFETLNTSRNQVTDQYKVDIGILCRGKNLDVAALLREVKSIARRFARFTADSAVCFKIENNPLYDVELLRQRNQFTSVLTLHFKENCNV